MVSSNIFMVLFLFQIVTLSGFSFDMKSEVGIQFLSFQMVSQLLCTFLE